ncbi:hypothetical protein MCEMSE15_00083 [Fimbriimonadaceae bacterium]
MRPADRGFSFSKPNLRLGKGALRYTSRIQPGRLPRRASSRSSLVPSEFAQPKLGPYMKLQLPERRRDAYATPNPRRSSLVPSETAWPKPGPHAKLQLPKRRRDAYATPNPRNSSLFPSESAQPNLGPHTRLQLPERRRDAYATQRLKPQKILVVPQPFSI